MAINQVKVIGLQRSGTNWLTELVRHNFDVKVHEGWDCTYGWKHALPSETMMVHKDGRVSNWGLPMGQLVQWVDDLLVLVVVKDLDSWKKSITKNRAGLKQKRQWCFRDGYLDLDIATRFYYQYINDWQRISVSHYSDRGLKSKKPRITTLKYESLLDNPIGYMKSIESDYNLKPKRQLFENVKRVPQSGTR